MASDGKFSQLTALYAKNVANLQHIRNYAINEMSRLLEEIKEKCEKSIAFDSPGNLSIDWKEGQVEKSKQGALTSDWLCIEVEIKYKKVKRHKIADFGIGFYCGEFDLGESEFYWVVYSRTRDKPWGNDFDELLFEKAKSDTGLRFSKSIKKHDENTLLYCSDSVSEDFSIEDAVKDVKAVVEFIYLMTPKFDEAWKDETISDSEDSK